MNPTGSNGGGSGGVMHRWESERDRGLCGSDLRGGGSRMGF